MLKNSHFRTPRMARDGYWQSGYKSADPRDFWKASGHIVLNVLCVAGLVVFIPLVIMGIV